MLLIQNIRQQTDGKKTSTYIQHLHLFLGLLIRGHFDPQYELHDRQNRQ